jgi:hypothetical protein
MTSDLGFLTCRTSYTVATRPSCAFRRPVCAPATSLRILGCMTHRYYHPTAERARGGTVIVMKDCICCVPVGLRSPLHVIAVLVHLPTLRFTLCNIYLPPAVSVRRADWRNYCHSYFHHTSFSGILIQSMFLDVEA